MQRIGTLVVLWIMLILFVLPATCWAGTLSGFEHELKKKDPKTENTGEEGCSHSDHLCNGNEEAPDTTSSIMGDIFNMLFANGGISSWERVTLDENTHSSMGAERREQGEALLPFARFDIGYQNVESDVTAMDYRGEMGYGPFGVQARFTRYEEDRPPDDLETIQIHALYRMSFGNHVGVDWGIGSLIINGVEQHSGLSVTIPISIHPYDFVGIELRPAWSTIEGTDLQDIELSLLAGWKYLSLKAGYRWFRTGSASLDGPQFGISAYW